MAVLNFLAALLAAMLAAMGVGGGGLLVIYLVMVLETEQLPAQGINLIFFICASLCSLPFHIAAGRIKWKVVAVFAFAGAIGAYFGCKTGLSTNPETVRSVFGYFLILAGAITFFKVFKPMTAGIRRRLEALYNKKTERS